MKPISDALKTHLESGGPYRSANLVTVTLLSGAVMRWTDWDVDVVADHTYFSPTTGPTAANAQLFSATPNAPVISRGTIRTQAKLGVTVETSDIELGFGDGTSVLVNGKHAAKATTDGDFDQAAVQVDRVFLNADGSSIGTVRRYVGIVADPEVRSTTVVLHCESRAAILRQQKLPRHQFSYTCSAVFKDAQCAYAGADESCARTLQACIQKGNTIRFRGFPWMPAETLATGVK